MRIVQLLVTTVATLISSNAAISFNLSQASLSRDANATLTHTITGLATGEKVYVERIADLNNNGAVDAGEPVTRAFHVTDGVRSTIAGIVNGNVPGDNDASTNGAIRIDLNFPGVDIILNRQPGRYLIRVTGPSGSATQPFEILTPISVQSITGIVRNASNNAAIPRAIVVILAGDGIPVGSVRADATGAYNIASTVGSYALLAFSDGYVGAFTPVSVPAGQIVNQNVLMQTAPTRITGRVSESAGNNPLPAAFVLAESDNGITGALTDASGNYSIAVPAGAWQLHVLSEAAAQLGCISDDGEEIAVTSTPITHNISLAPANSLIYGRITNPSNAPLPGLPVRAQGMNPALSITTEFEVTGRTTANGDYWLAISGGPGAQWEYGIGEMENQSLLAPTFNISPTANQAQQSNFSLTAATQQITGSVKNSSNQGLANIELHARATINSTAYEFDAITDGSGNFAIPVINGNWSLNFNCNDIEEMNLACPGGQSVVVSNNNPNVNIILQSFIPTATLSGTVRHSSGAPLGNVQLVASKNLFTRSGQSDPTTGAFSIGVDNGQWYLQISGNPPAGLLGPTLQFTVANNASINNINFRLIPADITLSGTVRNSAGAPLSGIRIFLSGTVSNISYNMPLLTTASNGTFSAQVARGTWLLIFDCEQLTSMNYVCSLPTSVDTTAGNVDRLLTLSNPVTSPNLLTPKLITGGATPIFQFTIAGQPATYDIQGSPYVPFTNGLWRNVDSKTILAGQTSAIVNINPQENRFFRVQAR